MIGIILGGGHGTRLKPLTDHTPKSLIPINGRPILEHIIYYMRCAAISEISCISDMQKPVRPWLETHEPKIRIVDQDAPIGTGQAVHLALSEGRRGDEEARERGGESRSEDPDKSPIASGQAGEMSKTLALPHTHIPALSKQGVLVMLGDIIPVDFLLADLLRSQPTYSILGVNESGRPDPMCCG